MVSKILLEKTWEVKQSWFRCFLNYLLSGHLPRCPQIPSTFLLLVYTAKFLELSEHFSMMSSFPRQCLSIQAFSNLFPKHLSFTFIIPQLQKLIRALGIMVGNYLIPSHITWTLQRQTLPQKSEGTQIEELFRFCLRPDLDEKCTYCQRIFFNSSQCNRY